MRAFLRNTGLLLLVVVTVLLCYLALTRDTDVASPPTADGDASASGDGEAAPDPSTPPKVVDQLRADFATSEQLPPGSRTYDNATTGSPLQVRDGLLSHEAPKGNDALGSLEVELSDQVQKLGARIVYPDGPSGSVNLVAWSSSYVDAREGDQPVPTSGLRLELTSTDWQLTVYEDGDSVIAGDEFTAPPGPQTFEVYRSDDRAWVVDPTGAVTSIQNPAIAALAGPWACWQVGETSARDLPAGIQSIWAG